MYWGIEHWEALEGKREKIYMFHGSHNTVLKVQLSLDFASRFHKVSRLRQPQPDVLLHLVFVYASYWVA